MNVRTIAIAVAVLIVGAVAITFAFSAQSTTSTSGPEGPRPIAGITSQVVTEVPDAALRDASVAFFTSLLERQYRGRGVPIKSATPTIATRLEAIPAAGSPDLNPRIGAIRYTQRANGVRDVTVMVDQGLADDSTQPLAASFRQIDGEWLVTGLPTLDGDTERDSDQAPQRQAPPAATRVVRAYALAARSWTAATLRSQYREQLRLSTGALKRELQRFPPTAAQISAYDSSNERASAQIRDVQLVRLTPTALTFSIVLAERTTSAGTTRTQHTVNTAELQLHGGRWLVANFTASP